MSPSLYSVSHASTIIDDERPNEFSDPATFTEVVGKQSDPYFVRFDENDSANPKASYFSALHILFQTNLCPSR
jgi:hypothetical protein